MKQQLLAYCDPLFFHKYFEGGFSFLVFVGVLGDFMGDFVWLFLRCFVDFLGGLGFKVFENSLEESFPWKLNLKIQL
jgi:hypothetical protein